MLMAGHERNLNHVRTSRHRDRIARAGRSGGGNHRGRRPDPLGEQTTVTVLIPAHNEADRLAECLDAIAAQTRPPDQIVVVADRCTDHTAAVAAARGTVVVTAEYGAKSKAQNEGLPYVAGDVLVCVDADTVLAPDVVELFLADLDEADATCANMLPMPTQRGFWVASRRFAYALGRYWWRWCQNQVGRLMVLSGCAYAMRTQIVRDLGGFPGGLITCDMDLTWSLYERGYRTSFCHRALAYTYDPETARVYFDQMRRWSSGFYQNFGRHWRQVLRSPAAMLVVGGLLYDLLMMPVTYVAAGIYIARSPSSANWVWESFLLHWGITSAIASRTIGWRRALVSFPAYWLVNWLNKALYLWTFAREWLLGRHYRSWTGRQGRKVDISPMPASRYYLGATLIAAAGAFFVAYTIPLPSPPAGTAPAAVAPRAAPATPAPRGHFVTRRPHRPEPAIEARLAPPPEPAPRLRPRRAGHEIPHRIPRATPSATPSTPDEPPIIEPPTPPAPDGDGTQP
jgi:cellulose synthase/poly-beta-1,6-N-acetylglucosamine synthase-like glycosyltransferase